MNMKKMIRMWFFGMVLAFALILVPGTQSSCQAAVPKKVDVTKAKTLNSSSSYTKVKGNQLLKITLSKRGAILLKFASTSKYDTIEYQIYNKSGYQIKNSNFFGDGDEGWLNASMEKGTYYVLPVCFKKSDKVVSTPSTYQVKYKVKTRNPVYTKSSPASIKLTYNADKEERYELTAKEVFVDFYPSDDTMTFWVKVTMPKNREWAVGMPTEEQFSYSVRVYDLNGNQMDHQKRTDGTYRIPANKKQTTFMVKVKLSRKANALNKAFAKETYVMIGGEGWIGEIDA